MELSGTACIYSVILLWSTFFQTLHAIDYYGWGLETASKPGDFTWGAGNRAAYKDTNTDRAWEAGRDECRTLHSLSDLPYIPDPAADSDLNIFNTNVWLALRRFSTESSYLWAGYGEAYVENGNQFTQSEDCVVRGVSSVETALSCTTPAKTVCSYRAPWCPIGWSWSDVTQTCYWASDAADTLPHDAAETECQSLGQGKGHLAMPKSQEAWDDIASLVTPSDAWIGLRKTPEGSPLWKDGTYDTSSLFTLANGQCGSISPSTSSAGATCSQPKQYICEFKPDLRQNVALSNNGGSCSKTTNGGNTESCLKAIDGDPTTGLAVAADDVITINLGSSYDVSAVRFRRNAAGFAAAWTVNIGGTDHSLPIYPSAGLDEVTVALPGVSSIDITVPTSAGGLQEIQVLGIPSANSRVTCERILSLGHTAGRRYPVDVTGSGTFRMATCGAGGVTAVGSNMESITLAQSPVTADYHWEISTMSDFNTTGVCQQRMSFECVVGDGSALQELTGSDFTANTYWMNPSDESMYNWGGGPISGGCGCRTSSCAGGGICNCNGATAATDAGNVEDTVNLPVKTLTLATASTVSIGPLECTTQASACESQHVEQRVVCGWTGIEEADCMQLGCCFLASQCFRSNDEASASVNGPYPRNCQDVLERGWPNGDYVIDPVADDDIPPLLVKCDVTFDPALTVVHHNVEGGLNTEYKDTSATAGRFKGGLQYGATLEQLKLLVDEADGCSQSVNYAGIDSPITESGSSTQMVYWNDRDGTMNTYFTADNSMCQCGIYSNCYGTAVSCNNEGDGATSGHRLTDSGFITDKTKLPISSIAVGAADARLIIGPLKCWNYNCQPHEIGGSLNSADLSATLPGTSDETILENYALTSNGSITSWFFQASAVGDIVLSVYRPVSDKIYERVDSNRVTASAVGLNRYDVPPDLQISASVGDVIGFSSGGITGDLLILRAGVVSDPLGDNFATSVLTGASGAIATLSTTLQIVGLRAVFMPDDEPTWDFKDGKCYSSSPESATYEAASESCEAVGADLTTIMNQNEEDYILTLAPVGPFVGLHDNSGHIEWKDNFPLSYTKFNPENGMRHRLVCENNTTMLKCEEEDQMIRIHMATYGRTSTTKCMDEDMFGPVGCTDPDAILTVRDLCQGRRECFLDATTGADFQQPPPCTAADIMYLEVIYDCANTTWCPDGYDLVGGSCFKVGTPALWALAASACEADGAMMAAFETQAEMDDVVANFTGLTPPMWVSLGVENGEYVWASTHRLDTLDTTGGSNGDCFTLNAANSIVTATCSDSHPPLCEYPVRPSLPGVYVDPASSTWMYHNSTVDTPRPSVCAKAVSHYHPMGCQVVTTLGQVATCPSEMPEVVSCVCGCPNYAVDSENHECVCSCSEADNPVTSAICCQEAHDHGIDREMSLECTDAASAVESPAGLKFETCPEGYPHLVSCGSATANPTIAFTEYCISDNAANSMVAARCCRLVDAPRFGTVGSQFATLSTATAPTASWMLSVSSVVECQEACLAEPGCVSVYWDNGICHMSPATAENAVAGSFTVYQRIVRMNAMLTAHAEPYTMEEVYMRDLASIVASPEEPDLCYMACHENVDCILAEFVNDTCYFSNNHTTCCAMATQWSVKRYFLSVGTYASNATGNWIQHQLSCNDCEESGDPDSVSCVCSSGAVETYAAGVCTCSSGSGTATQRCCEDDAVVLNAPPICPPGSILENNYCTPCPELQVSYNINSEQCTTCDWPGYLPDMEGRSYCYRCDDDYIPVGNYCEPCDTGSYTAFRGALECSVIDCGAPYNVSNGTAHYENTTFGNVAYYTCGEGFELVNMSGLIMCSCEGEWVGDNVTCHDIDECDPDPCVNGTCLNLIAMYECNCTAGYNGTNCTEEIDECLSDPCQNDGNCTDLIDEYTCWCWPGFTGIHCETNIDDCEPEPCENGGTCTDLINDYNCTCPLGTTGVNCEDVVNCSVPASRNHSEFWTDGTYIYGTIALFECDAGYEVVNGTAMLVCSCDGTWMGDDFECIEINECEEDPCQNAATCHDLVDAFDCECAPGWTGETCEINIDECENVTCGDGFCEDLIADFKCNCRDGFNGTFCELNIDDCPGHECENGGICVDGVLEYTCNCTSPYVGERCEFDSTLDECSPPEIPPCQNQATCVNIDEGYECECAPGYTGSDCETEIDECASDPCQNEGNCNDDIDGYTCDCVTGWEGFYCQDNIDDCTPNPCNNQGQCTDLVADHTCTCAEGYTGSQCETDIDECDTNPCGNSGTCENLPGSFNCQCTPEWTGDLCQYGVGVNECDLNPGPCVNGDCTDLDVGYSCTCDAGWTGVDCDVDINECASSPCRNNGTCIDAVNGYTCDCLNGTSGDNCEINADDCFPLACQNGGTCVDGINEFTCDCVQGWTGNSCEEDFSECSSDPCQNGGTCEEPDFAYYNCICVPPFTGYNCEFDMTENECRPVDPCQHDGTCEDLIAGFSCDCTEGWEGDVCDTSIDDCLDGICGSGGTCYDEHMGVACNCATGYTGDHCETNIDDCPDRNADPDPCEAGDIECCLNGADCVDELNSFSCACTPGYTGALCESGSNGCDMEPCLNGGTCEFLPAAPFYYCYCYEGWTGVDCETAIECPDPPTIASAELLEVDSSYGGIARYQCNFMYYPSADYPNSEKTCNTHGEWHPEGDTLECTGIPLPGIDLSTIEDLASLDPPTDTSTGAIVQCMPTPNIENGEKDSDEVTFGSIVMYNCVEGYNFRDGTRIKVTYCTADGVWSLDISHEPCVEVHCPYIDNPPHMIRTTDETVYGTVMEFACVPGYRFGDGSTTRSTICDATGRWTSMIGECIEDTAPQCDGASCAAMVTSVGRLCPELSTLTNGEIEENVDSDAFTVKCRYPERLPTGTYETNTVCTLEDRWLPDQLDCARRCPPVPLLANTTLEYVNTDPGAIANITCISGHRFPDGSRDKYLICQDDYSWDNPNDLTLRSYPACETVFCPSTPVVGSATALPPISLMVDAVVNYECQYKYMSTITNMSAFAITCVSESDQEYAEWSVTQPPDCILILCGEPLPLANAVYSFDGNGLDDQANYTCNDGARFEDGTDHHEVWCESNRAWTDIGGTCEYNRCGEPPVIQRSTITSVVSDRGGNVTYECDVGHIFPSTLLSNYTLACQEDNLEWQPIAEHCEEVRCENLYTLAAQNGHTQLEAVEEHVHNLYSQRAIVYCDIGYQFNVSKDLLTHNHTLECLADGSWSVDLADIVCEIVRCREWPSTFTYGSRIFTSNTYGSMATFVCLPGYFLADIRYFQSRATCRANGEWSYDPEGCAPVSCSAFPVWDSYTVSPSDNTLYGIVANYTCPNGTAFADLTTQKSTYCNISGYWVPAILPCSANGSALVIEITEATGSESIGAVAISLLSVCGIAIVSLDVFSVVIKIYDHPYFHNMRNG